MQSLGRFAQWLIDERGWLLVLPLVFGFLAIWSLLPKVRKQPLLSSAACGVGALVQVGLIYLQPTGPVLFDVLFYAFAGLAIVAGALMILQTNAVHAALWFAVVILSTCGLFLLQSAPFLAAATVIVYAGAIIVTFLFVIMLAQQTGLAPYDRRSREPLLASLAGFVLLGGLLYALQVSYLPPVGASEAFVRLHQAHKLAESNASFEEIEEALHVDAEKTVGTALDELIQGLPAWPEREQTRGRLTDVLSRLGSANGTHDRAELNRAIQDLAQVAEEVERAGEKYRGVLPAPATAGSTLSRLPTKPGEVSRGHVTSLGRSLFGDYLWAVELAGTLLLAATVGAIAIAAKQGGTGWPPTRASVRSAANRGQPVAPAAPQAGGTR